jgi:hypothetical protein
VQDENGDLLFFLEFKGNSPGLSLTKRPKVITAPELKVHHDRSTWTEQNQSQQQTTKTPG